MCSRTRPRALRPGRSVCPFLGEGVRHVADHACVRDQESRRDRGGRQAHPRARSRGCDRPNDGGADLHFGRAHRKRGAACLRRPDARPRVRGRHSQTRIGGDRFRRGPARSGQRHHAVLPVRLLPARLHQPVRRRARRLQVHGADGWQHGRVLRRPGRASEPGPDSRRPARREGRLRV